MISNRRAGGISRSGTSRAEFEGRASFEKALRLSPKNRGSFGVTICSFVRALCCSLFRAMNPELVLALDVEHVIDPHAVSCFWHSLVGCMRTAFP